MLIVLFDHSWTLCMCDCALSKIISKSRVKRISSNNACFASYEFPFQNSRENLRTCYIAALRPELFICAPTEPLALSE